MAQLEILKAKKMPEPVKAVEPEKPIEATNTPNDLNDTTKNSAGSSEVSEKPTESSGKPVETSEKFESIPEKPIEPHQEAPKSDIPEDLLEEHFEL